MDFFEHQYRARRRTGMLVLAFILSVVAITLAVNAVAWVAASQVKDDPTVTAWMEGPLWIWTTLATLGIIFFGTARTMIQLRGGGRAVAEMVGARRLPAQTEDPLERRLINVVEEMSIASGTPRPVVYVLDGEPGINAFVAGLSPTEAVLVATRGALEHLSRDELQGVVGHEYSHILNGDMRLNVRLMGIVAGLLLLGQLGRALMRSDRSSRKGNVVLVGLALFLVGYIGVFCGSLIKAAVSRQREFLADASSVQFTRNPDGIAGALWKILQHARGSLLNNAHSDDLSHFCFGESVRAGFTSLLATHPPLEERIRIVSPTFLGRARAGKLTPPPERPEPAPAVPGVAAGFAGAAAAPPAAAASASPGAVADSIGHVWPVHLAFAERMHAALPAELLEALHDARRAPLVLYALLLEGMSNATRAEGQAALAAADSPEAAAAAHALAPLVRAAGEHARLILVNLAMPVLKELDAGARRRFLEALERIAKSDGRYSVFEYALVTIVREHLAEDSERRHGAERFFRYSDVMEDIRLLLTVMARVGAGSDSAAAAAFRQVMVTFQREPGDPLPAAACTLTSLGTALDRLNGLTPMLKRSVIEACADCVINDGQVMPREAELLQAVALSLDCPLPPLLQR